MPTQFLLKCASPSSRAPSRRPSPLRTVRETFASHGSSTQERPSEKQGRSLIQVQMRPTRYGLAANSHGNGYHPPGVCEAAPTACAVVICIASLIGSANVLEFEYHREVGSVSSEVMWSHKGKTIEGPAGRALGPSKYFFGPDSGYRSRPVPVGVTSWPSNLLINIDSLSVATPPERR